MNSNFFIGIGPPKTGTSWLYATLKQHPEVYLPNDKEIRYFWIRQFLGQATVWKKMFGRHWHFKGKRKNFRKRMLVHVFNIFRLKVNFKEILWEFKYLFRSNNDIWYLNLFDFSKLSGDISPKYCELSNNEIQHIQNLIPNMKIIISLRDPVDREWSRCKMNLLKKKGIKDYRKVDASLFGEHFKDEYQHRSNDYVELVERWKKYFPEKNIFIFFYEELQNDPQKLLDRICKFLKIAPMEFKYSNKIVNPGIKQEIPEEYKKELVRLNYKFIIKMQGYFGTEYPSQWLRKYSDK